MIKLIATIYISFSLIGVGYGFSAKISNTYEGFKTCAFYPETNLEMLFPSIKAGCWLGGKVE